MEIQHPIEIVVKISFFSCLSFCHSSRLINKNSKPSIFAEADVNTATPSLGNAAATWAGWAVTAVTAKFYRSQSDTVKSVNPVSSKMLSKPGSLGKYYQGFILN